MVTDPNYQPRTLLAPFEQGPLVPTFLRDTFFGGREYPATNLIEFDFRRGRRKMAPFVAPLVGGKVMERAGFETRFFSAPRIAPIRNLRIPDLEARMFGETIYNQRTPADRAAELLAEDAVFCDEAISRREEWMCRELMVNGQITITADHGYQQVINFMESSAGATDNHMVPTIKWDQTNSDPLADLETARLATIAASGIAPNVVLFGAEAKSVFINNAKVKELLDNRRYEMGTIRPSIQSDSVVLFGTVPGLQLYSYSEYFEDDLGVLYPMLPEDFVMLASTNVQNKIVYGAFTQLEDARAKRFVTYQTSRIPFVYGDEENGNLFYRLTSQPLPMPADVLGWRIIEALTAGGGPQARKAGTTLEGRPYFAPTGETAHEKNMPELSAELKEEAGQAHMGLQEEKDTDADGKETAKSLVKNNTEDELRDIADNEGADISGCSNKTEIAKAIIKHRKDKED